MTERNPLLPLLLLVTALGACEPSPIPEAADPVAGRGSELPGDPPTPPDGVAADLPADTTWTASVTGAGAALILSGADGSELLRLSCARDPAVLAIDSDAFEQIGSEERLSFGVDDEPFVFVADVSVPRPRGVHAEAPVDPDLLARLDSATRVSAVYGAQTVGPHEAPDRQMVANFTRACREAAGLD